VLRGLKEDKGLQEDKGLKVLKDLKVRHQDLHVMVL
jgi:hypothetical protein